MSFYAFLVGPGEGCDYTIGCNQRLDKLKAKTKEKALDEIKEKYFCDLDERSVKNYDNGINSISILEVVDEENFDIDGLIAFYRKKAIEKENKKIENHEKAELKRLQKKYGESL